MAQGRIVIISGPSGSGKTTLYKKLIADKEFSGKLIKSISATTRPRRPGERHGRDYLFFSRPMFLYKKRAGHFLESQKVFLHYYGTPYKTVRDLIKAGKHVLLCIDVKGARVVRRKHPDTLNIFVKTPSLEELKKRLSKRGTEHARDLAVRLRTARAELKDARHYDYIVINDALARAYGELKKVIRKELFDPKRPLRRL